MNIETRNPVAGNAWKYNKRQVITPKKKLYKRVSSRELMKRLAE